MARRAIDATTIERVCEMYRAGAAWLEIERALDISKQRIAKIISEAGLPRRSGESRPRRKRAVKSTAERFWPKVRFGAPEDCWEWQGSVLFGYGKFGEKIAGRWVASMAHRVAYKLEHGEIPDGLYVCHSCDNRRCCNPQHLWLGTATDNMRDCANKGRVVSPLKKLDDDAVISIQAQLRAGGQAIVEIARRFGVSAAVIHRINSGERGAGASRPIGYRAPSL